MSIPQSPALKETLNLIGRPQQGRQDRHQELTTRGNEQYASSHYRPTLTASWTLPDQKVRCQIPFKRQNCGAVTETLQNGFRHAGQQGIFVRARPPPQPAANGQGRNPPSENQAGKTSPTGDAFPVLMKGDGLS
ncbi:hypothetical protein CIHG_06784 [Coccidioides immitis H538.4]|uniref:Uncharacterized protein n=1 Tax=Coccidioides immitis H538.4 TaxID=396776 RepID=A0A0J8UN44_COCIT|nr:hypothetical protein CIHG_06784 [Coccidioides immitis H538.4]